MQQLCNLDNFIVKVGVGSSATSTIEGIDMISPHISVRVISPFFLSDDFFNDGKKEKKGEGGSEEEELRGQYLDVDIEDNAPPRLSSGEGAGNSMYRSGGEDESVICHLFGAVLYEMYAERPPVSEERTQTTDSSSLTMENLMMNDDEEGEQQLPRLVSRNPSSRNGEEEPSRKRGSSAPSSLAENVDAAIGEPKRKALSSGQSKYVPLKELGFPASLSLLVDNLIECGWEEFRPDEAISLKDAKDDLHLLLQDPSRFLFDRVPDQDTGRVALDIKQNKLYGREAERSLIVDVFCRVSMTGESEALFIAGFSGSGKSTLVQSVLEYVDVTGGNVIQKKFDNSSSPMSFVIAAFNDLCPLIREKCSPEELNAIVVGLIEKFGANLSVLIRVLPNVVLLIPELVAVPKDEHTEINLSRICFVLQLFMRVVSNKSHPVMMFLDDLHWADSASLDVLRYILSDIKGSSCFYFVGSYRSNEVPEDHAIFKLMSDLEICSCRLNRIQLDSMKIEEVNPMISDALGTFPRICLHLSQLVLRKTKGNPLFVLECLRSLVDRGLLQYSFRARCWTWDTDKISAEDITDNVCELLTTKMVGLRGDTQLALKIASCFGTTVDSTIIKVLMSASPIFSSLQRELQKSVEDGFMNEDAGSYRFVHDKVREAAYGLLDKENRSQVGKMMMLTDIM
jgi:hypothetical protein